MTRKPHTIPHGQPPSWLPDWKDENAYHHPEYGPRLWAWEFLRRNQQYQADYQKWVAGGYSRKLEYELYESWGVSELYDPACDPVDIHSYWGDQEAMPPLFLEFESENGSLPQDGSGMGGGRVSLRCGSGFPPTDDSRQFFVRIDVRYPLDKQWAQVKEFYDARRRGLKEFSFDDFVNPVGPQASVLVRYLRIFDAVWSGARDKDIAEVLFPGCEWDPPQGKYPKKITSSLASARRLVKGGYRDVLIWG